jgi:hypothetical protein
MKEPGPSTQFIMSGVGLDAIDAARKSGLIYAPASGEQLAGSGPRGIESRVREPVCL